jgi:AraC family transcriptional regulator of adaptative response/methylated-DNA-[protein]-cysteine methyltransferase
MNSTLSTAGPVPVTNDPRWAALVSRQASASLFYGVKTTRVFCRTGCASRRPRPENVRFFDSVADALAAGFRPCKRCQPEGPGYRAELDARIVRACRQLQQAEAAPAWNDVARSVGMSPFHFLRLFKARLGVTPKQYQAAHRLDRFRKELGRGDNVTSALYDAGFRSSSRAYTNVSRKLGMLPRQYQHGGEGVQIAFGFERTSLGWVLLAATGKGVCALEIGDHKKALRDSLISRFPRADLLEDRSAVAGLLKVIAGFLAEPQPGLSLPLDIRGTAFQRRVWEALQKIPLGEIATYQDIARRLGMPRAVRAVANACAANPVALVVPCHRVVRTDGKLGGYRWGLERKQALLKGEKASEPSHLPCPGECDSGSKNSEAGLSTRPH